MTATSASAQSFGLYRCSPREVSNSRRPPLLRTGTVGGFLLFPGGGDDTYAAPVDRYVSIRNILVTTPEGGGS